MVEAKNIFLVTHGKKRKGANPGMTKKGFKEIASLSEYIPINPSLVISGTGKRHMDVAKALGLIPRFYSFMPGRPESLMPGTSERVMLTDGTIIDRQQYQYPADFKESSIKWLASLPNDTVVCTGRPIGKMLDIEAKSAAVYKVVIRGGKIKDIIELAVAGNVGAGQKEV